MPFPVLGVSGAFCIFILSGKHTKWRRSAASDLGLHYFPRSHLWDVKSYDCILAQ